MASIPVISTSVSHESDASQLQPPQPLSSQAQPDGEQQQQQQPLLRACTSYEYTTAITEWQHHEALCHSLTSIRDLHATVTAIRDNGGDPFNDFTADHKYAIRAQVEKTSARTSPGTIWHCHTIIVSTISTIIKSTSRAYVSTTRASVTSLFG